MNKTDATKEKQSADTTLSNIAQGKRTKELYFDPTTGRLMTMGKNQIPEDSDAVPATEMAREGFFAGNAPQKL